MRQVLLVLGLIICTSGIARAACNQFEVAGSYDYVRVNSTFTVPTETTGSGGGTTQSSTSVNLNGWNAEVAGNPTCWLGIVGSFSGVYASPVSGVSDHAYSYVFGPRLNLHNSTPFTPFVEALFGGVTAGQTGFASQNSFEGNFGGGVDISLGGHWAIRPKADYVPTHFDGKTQNNAAVSVAIVFKLGGS